MTRARHDAALSQEASRLRALMPTVLP